MDIYTSIEMLFSTYSYIAAAPRSKTLISPLQHKAKTEKSQFRRTTFFSPNRFRFSSLLFAARKVYNMTVYSYINCFTGEQG